MNDIPLISVVIATYRRTNTLEKALESLLHQTYKCFEVILVDDNCDKIWSSKVSEIVYKYSFLLKIKYIVNANNLGSAKARNVGIFNSNGDYISFLDDDDVYLPLKLESQLNDMRAKNADFGITDLYLYDEKDNLIDKRVRWFIRSTKKEDLIKYHLLYHLTGTDTLMFKRSFLLRIKGFPEIDVGDEFYLIKEAIMKGGSFSYLKGCNVKAYIHFGENHGLSSGNKKIEGEKRLYEEKKKYFSYLTKKEICRVRMRHYAVLAFAYYRMKKTRAASLNTLRSFLCSPIGFIEMVMNHR